MGNYALNDSENCNILDDKFEDDTSASMFLCICIYIYENVIYLNLKKSVMHCTAFLHAFICIFTEYTLKFKNLMPIHVFTLKKFFCIKKTFGKC